MILVGDRNIPEWYKICWHSVNGQAVYRKM